MVVDFFIVMDWISNKTSKLEQKNSLLYWIYLRVCHNNVNIMNRIVSREYLTLGINFDSCLDFLSRIIHKNQKKKCNNNNQKCTISFLAASSHHALNYTLDIFFFKRITITQYFVNLKKRELSHQFTQDSVQPNMPITMLILRI